MPAPFSSENKMNKKRGVQLARVRAAGRDQVAIPDRGGADRGAIYDRPRHYLRPTAAVFMADCGTIYGRPWHYLWPTAALFTTDRGINYGRPQHYL